MEQLNISMKTEHLITKITKTKYGYNIFFLDEKINVEEQTLIYFRLNKGQFITDKDLENIIKYNETEFIKRKSLVYLIRKRSVLEFKTYLRTLKASNKLIEQLTKEYKQKNYLNDFEFAESLVERLGIRYGKNKIKSELVNKGIHSDIINNLMEGYENKNIEYILEKACKTVRANTYKQAYDKVVRSLISKGFSLSEINKHIDNYLFKENFDQTKSIKLEYQKLLNKYKNKYEDKILINKIKVSLYQKGYSKDLIEEIVRSD